MAQRGRRCQGEWPRSGRRVASLTTQDGTGPAQCRGRSAQARGRRPTGRRRAAWSRRARGASREPQIGYKHSHCKLARWLPPRESETVGDPAVWRCLIVRPPLLILLPLVGQVRGDRHVPPAARGHAGVGPFPGRHDLQQAGPSSRAGRSPKWISGGVPRTSGGGFELGLARSQRRRSAAP
jgi:hypothetical protein